MSGADCNADLGHQCDSGKNGAPCASCRDEAAYWQREYAATPESVRRLDRMTPAEFNAGVDCCWTRAFSFVEVPMITIEEQRAAAWHLMVRNDITMGSFAAHSTHEERVLQLVTDLIVQADEKEREAAEYRHALALAKYDPAERRDSYDRSPR